MLQEEIIQNVLENNKIERVLHDLIDQIIEVQKHGFPSLIEGKELASKYQILIDMKLTDNTATKLNENLCEVLKSIDLQQSKDKIIEILVDRHKEWYKQDTKK